MRKKFIVFGSIIFIFILSCLSDGTTTFIPSFATGLENIKHNLEKEKIDLFEAYIEANKYLRKIEGKDKEYSEARNFIQFTIDEMNNEVKKMFDSKKYDDSLRYALSLDVIGIDSSISINEIYYKVSQNADASSDVFTQFDIKEEMADNSILTTEDTYKLLKTHALNKSRGVFLYQYQKYIKKYPDLLNKFPDLINYKTKMDKLKDLNFEELMNSVVLVILDKGLNAKKGVKYSDKSLGTGFFIDEDGYILTNHHVIADHVDPKYEGYTAVKVFTKDKPNGPAIPAKVVGYDEIFDIALLKIPVQNKNYLTLGRSLDMKVGDKIYTIGNPLGVQYTVTSGIISNTEIDAFQLGRCFMIDAAINPGNSGGPLIDDRGQVVGIVFAGIPQYEGMNFAIPFQWVRKSISKLYNGGEVKRCWIGSGIHEDNGDVKFYYILPNGPAYKAGINVEDKLISIDGIEVENVEHAQSVLAWKRFPMLSKVIIERNGKKIEKIVRLEKRPLYPVETAFKKDTTGNLVTLIFGIGLEYYEKKMFTRKYKTTKLYNGVYSPMIDLDLHLGEGDPITIYDLKYIEKDKLVVLSMRYKNKELGVVERPVSLAVYAGINKIL